MSVYNIRYMKFFLNKLDWIADNFRPWLRLRKWYPEILWKKKKWQFL